MDRVQSVTSLSDLGAMLESIFEESDHCIEPQQLLDLVTRTGLSLEDDRVASDLSVVRALPADAKLSLRDVLDVARKNLLLETALSGNLVVRDFEYLSSELDACYQKTLNELRQTRASERGQVSTKTPKLARVPPNKTAASFCSIHGQKWNRGEYAEPFTVQEACAPLIYCTALMQEGVDVVHKHVGREPSPNSSGLLLDHANKAHNPFVEAGMIMGCALLLGNGAPLADSFNQVKQSWAEATGQTSIGFGNSHYLSLRNKGNKAFCLSYMMNEARAFPSSGEKNMEDLLAIVDFFFMNCSIEATCESLAAFAGTLAGGGVCPTTNTRVFPAEHVRSCLSMMSSCGMNDYSGSLQFTIGYPCKSSTSGFTMLVIPNLGGFATFSPRIDTNFNSVFGLRFATNLVHQFPLHSFNSYVVQDSHVYQALLSRNAKVESELSHASFLRSAENDHHELFYAAAEGNCSYIRRLYARGVDVTLPDYDMRTALHIAAANGHLEAVKLLCIFGANLDAQDRLGSRPVDDARTEGHDNIVAWLEMPFDGAVHREETYEDLCSLGEPGSLAARDEATSEVTDLDENDGTAIMIEDTPPFAPLSSPSAIPEEAPLIMEPIALGSPKQESFSDSAASGSVTSENGPSRSVVSSGIRTYNMLLDIYTNVASAAGESEESEDEVAPLSKLIPGKLQGSTSDDQDELNQGVMERLLQSLTQVGQSSSVEEARRPATIADLTRALRNQGIHTQADSLLGKELSRLTGEDSSVAAAATSRTSEAFRLKLARAANRDTTAKILPLARSSVLLTGSGSESKSSSKQSSSEPAAANPAATKASADPFKNGVRNSQVVADDKIGPSNPSSCSTTSSGSSSHGGASASNSSRKRSPVLTAPTLRKLITKYPYVRKVLEGRTVINNFPAFTETVKQIYHKTEPNTQGQVAQYIPQLARVDPDQFGVGVCSVDAQQFSYGDSDVPFCVQSCMKPINYCIAQELIGPELVHKHVGYEPSGLNFNELTLNKYGLPHNPLINAGAIVTSSLIVPDNRSEDRFDFVTSVWTKLTGGIKPGYSNETCLSEYATADRNFCLAYLMKEKGAFPSYVNSSLALRQVLEFYFSCCSIELTCDTLAVVAASLANGGINPVTQERVFSSETCRNCLSIMASSGMYDFSGEFQFTMGVPAKSGVSGALLIVVPNVMGICVWSPRLDRLGNSARGIEFCTRLQEQYAFHRYSLLRGASKAYDVRDYTRAIDAQRRTQRLIEAATRGDVKGFKLLLSEGDVSVNASDYDGRCPIHLAASEGHLRFVVLLHENGAELSPVDRWGGTPLSDARSQGHDAVVAYLQKHGARVGPPPLVAPRRAAAGSDTA